IRRQSWSLKKARSWRGATTRLCWSKRAVIISFIWASLNWSDDMEKKEIRKALMDAEFARKQLLKPYFLDLGLTLGQGQPRILRTLKTNGSMTQRELADFCRMDVTNMSRTLDRLEENGL